MITENQLRALDFEYNELFENWTFKDITFYLDSELQKGYEINYYGFELEGINDHRDLSKFIKLVYGE